MLSFGNLHTYLIVGNFIQGGQAYVKRVLRVKQRSRRKRGLCK